MDKHISNSLDADVQQYEQQQDFDPYELMYICLLYTSDAADE